jgi:hypothetical protein
MRRIFQWVAALGSGRGRGQKKERLSLESGPWRRGHCHIVLKKIWGPGASKTTHQLQWLSRSARKRGRSDVGLTVPKSREKSFSGSGSSSESVEAPRYTTISPISKRNMRAPAMTHRMFLRAHVLVSWCGTILAQRDRTQKEHDQC